MKNKTILFLLFVVSGASFISKKNYRTRILKKISPKIDPLDPASEIRDPKKKFIPDPGGKKAPDPGSGTLPLPTGTGTGGIFSNLYGTGKF
jgi:hypothetical protein